MSTEDDGDDMMDMPSVSSTNKAKLIVNDIGVIDLASPVIFETRPDFLTPEAPVLKAKRGTGGGKRRIYENKYQSVESTLRKQVKLDTAIYLRWQKLRGTLSHNDFAEMLMDMFEAADKENAKSIIDSQKRYNV